MKTIATPLNPWSIPPTSTNRYLPTHQGGHRVLGWEDVNITLLAEDMGVQFRNLLAVLTGRRNCTLSLLQLASQTLGIPLSMLVTRIGDAYHLHQQYLSLRGDPQELKAKRRREFNQKRANERRERYVQ